MAKFLIKRGTHAYIGNMPLTFLADTEVDVPANGPDQIAEMLATAGHKAYGEHREVLAHDETIERDIAGQMHEVDVTVTYGAGGARIVTDKADSQPRPIGGIARGPVARQFQPGAPLGVLGAPVNPNQGLGVGFNPNANIGAQAPAGTGGVGTETTPGASGSGASFHGESEEVSSPAPRGTARASRSARGSLERVDDDERTSTAEADDVASMNLRSQPRTEFAVPPKRFPDEVQTATDPPREELVGDSPSRAVPYVGEFRQTGEFTRQPTRNLGGPGYPFQNQPGAGSAPLPPERVATEGRPMGTPDTPGQRDREFPKPSETDKNTPDETARALQGSSAPSGATGTTGQPVDKLSKSEQVKTGESEEDDDLSDLGEHNVSPEEADELPEEFPHLSLLKDAGRTKWSELQGLTVEDLSSEDFPGIGEAKASDIVAELRKKARRDKYRERKQREQE